LNPALAQSLLNAADLESALFSYVIFRYFLDHALAEFGQAFGRYSECPKYSIKQSDREILRHRLSQLSFRANGRDFLEAKIKGLKFDSKYSSSAKYYITSGLIGALAIPGALGYIKLGRDVIRNIAYMLSAFQISRSFGL
jgi:hypothetical protein